MTQSFFPFIANLYDTSEPQDQVAPSLSPLATDQGATLLPSDVSPFLKGFPVGAKDEMLLADGSDGVELAAFHGSVFACADAFSFPAAHKTAAPTCDDETRPQRLALVTSPQISPKEMLCYAGRDQGSPQEGSDLRPGRARRVPKRFRNTTFAAAENVTEDKQRAPTTMSCTETTTPPAKRARRSASSDEWHPDEEWGDAGPRLQHHMHPHYLTDDMDAWNPKEAQKMREQLYALQNDLKTSTAEARNLTGAAKKRFRNRLASRVSRLRKKLHAYDMRHQVQELKEKYIKLEQRCEYWRAAYTDSLVSLRQCNDQAAHDVEQRRRDREAE